jgi:hypothetical protein
MSDPNHACSQDSKTVFCGECTDCGWNGPPVSTIEEAMRDADAHQCPSQQDKTS